MSKTNTRNFFEDFRIGQVIKRATPCTVTIGDVALYTVLYGSRFAKVSDSRKSTRHIFFTKRSYFE
jgi:2-methylfumaryl-CoA hydratase